MSSGVAYAIEHDLGLVSEESVNQSAQFYDGRNVHPSIPAAISGIECAEAHQSMAKTTTVRLVHGFFER